MKISHRKVSMIWAILLLLGFEILLIPYFFSVSVKAEALSEIKIGIVVSEQSYDMGFDTRVGATDFYMYYTNETLKELKRRGFGGIYSLSDLDINSSSSLSEYDIVWVSTYAANLSQQTAVQDYVEAGGCAVIGGTSFAWDWTGSYSSANYYLKTFANIDTYELIFGQYGTPFDVFGLKQAPTMRAEMEAYSGRAYTLNISRSDPNLGEEYGEVPNSNVGNPWMILTPRENGFIVQIATDIVAGIGGMVADPCQYSGASYGVYGALDAGMDNYVYLWHKINTLLLQMKGDLGYARGFLFKPLAGRIPDVMWMAKHDVDYSSMWDYAFENGNGTHNYIDLFEYYSLKSQFNLRLDNTSMPTARPYYDIASNATKLSFLKSLIDSGFGVSLHIEPWENLTGGYALDYQRFDYDLWDSLFEGHTYVETVQLHGAGYFDYYVDKIWKDLSDVGWIGSFGLRNYYKPYNITDLYNYGHLYTGFCSGFPFYAKHNGQYLNLVILPQTAGLDLDPSTPRHYELPINNTAVRKGIFQPLLHPDHRTTIAELEQLLKFVKVLRDDGYEVQYVNPDIITKWFMDFSNLNVTKVEVSSDSIKITVKNIGSYSLNDMTLRFDVNTSVYTDDSLFYYQNGGEFYAVIPSLAPNESKSITVKAGNPLKPHVENAMDNKLLHQVNVTGMDFTNECLTATVLADSGVTSTTKINCTDREPKKVFVVAGDLTVEAPRNFNSSTKILTVEATHIGTWHGSDIRIVVYFEVVYIKSDGTVDPPTAPISVIDDVYTFTGNIYQPIIVEIDNITIDGDGHTLEGPEAPRPEGPGGGYGFYLNQVTGVTIEGVNIREWGYGIYLTYSSGNRIIGNIMINNQRGIVLDYYNNYNTVGGNTITTNKVNSRAITLTSYSESNTITNNTMKHHCAGIGAYGYCSHNNMSGNTIVDNDAGITLAWYSNNNTVHANAITESAWFGLRIEHQSNSNRISYNDITDTENWHGILVNSSFNNLIYRNNIKDNPIQAYDTNPADNHWHHTDLLEGNYWSDYIGVDDGSGTGKHAVSGDGIGDTDIPWPEPDYDFYPFVQACILGDVTGDGIIDIYDLYRISKAYGATLDSPNWDESCDISGPSGLPDGAINILDLEITVENFGKTS